MFRTKWPPALQLSTRNRRGRRTSFKLSPESLEERSLLSGSITLVNKVVTITGTDMNDVATVRINLNGTPTNSSDDKVVVTLISGGAKFGQPVKFPISSVKSISFHGLDGDDTFTNFTSLPSTAFGGNGNDTLNGGAGRDDFNGGAGDDSLSGGKGNDFLDGGDGSDDINGGDGNDYVRGLKGDDFVSGDAGNDTVMGGEGNDHVYGYTGNDKVYGGVGDDVVFGGTGNDTLDGGDGKDHLYGDDGNDTLLGGTNAQGADDGFADKLEGDNGADRFQPEWVKNQLGWHNNDRPSDFSDYDKDYVLATATTPLVFTIDYLTSVKGTSELGADEPYVVFWVGRAQSALDATGSYADRTPVLENVNTGDTVFVAGPNVYGPDPIASPTDLIILATALENDNSSPDAVVTAVQAGMLPSLVSGLQNKLSRSDLVSKLESNMNGAIDIGVASGGINMDESSLTQEYALTQKMLNNARAGAIVYMTNSYIFNDGARFDVFVSVRRLNGLF
jgi:hypothetical protein